MSKFNPDFWEVTLSSRSWARFTTEDRLYYQAPGEAERGDSRLVRAQQLWPRVEQLIRDELTTRQREIVELYFLRGLNQRQIAEALRISQQSVSEHLHGKTRAGRSVGGALRKLRKACEKHGIRWP